MVINALCIVVIIFLRWISRSRIADLKLMHFDQHWQFLLHKCVQTCFVPILPPPTPPPPLSNCIVNTTSQFLQGKAIGFRQVETIAFLVLSPNSRDILTTCKTLTRGCFQFQLWCIFINHKFFGRKFCFRVCPSWRSGIILGTVFSSDLWLGSEDLIWCWFWGPKSGSEECKTSALIPVLSLQSLRFVSTVKNITFR